MEYYLPHELVLISYGKRIDPVQPKKNTAPWKNNEPTEREQIAYRLMCMDTTEDGRGHQFASNSMLVSCGVCKI